jgi:hypothetical protein
MEDDPEDAASPSEDAKLFQGLATAMPGIDEGIHCLSVCLFVCLFVCLLFVVDLLFDMYSNVI